MKKLYLLAAACLFLAAHSMAQAPHALNYQTVVRNSIGELEINKLVSFKISILSGSASGSVVYSETHNKVTNEFGLVTIEIGNGTAIAGIFDNIEWGSDIYFLKTEFDNNGGTDFSFMGTSQLLSVPYAIYAEKAGNAEDDNDKDSTNELQTIDLTGNDLSLSNNGGTADLAGYLDNTDAQTLSLNGNQLTITGGNTVTFTGAVDLDADPTNELQKLSYSNDTIEISQGNNIILPHDNDLDPTNEIQTLTINNNILTISQGNSVIVDADTANELQFLTIQQNQITISNGNTVNIDADTTNEIQRIAASNDTIFLNKNGGYIKLPNTFSNFYNTGDGSAGNFLSTGKDTIYGSKNFKNFFLQSGDTLFIKNTTFIKVQDSCFIDGVIYGKGRVNTGINGIGGTGGGGGGGDFSICEDQNLLFSYYGSRGDDFGPYQITDDDPFDFENETVYPNLQSIGGSGGMIWNIAPSTGTNGGDGSMFQNISNDSLINYFKELPLHGNKGGKGGAIESIYSHGGVSSGGLGGAGIYISCKYFYFSGNINLQGLPGNNGSLNYVDESAITGYTGTAGAGGGGGGSCIIIADSISNNTGSFSLQGGLGGVGVTGSFICHNNPDKNFSYVTRSGGTGGMGFYKIIIR